MHKLFIFFIFFTCNEYQSAIRTSCGIVLLRHGLNFSRAWRTMQLICDERYWKHVSVQKVVTLNICCNVACLTFHLPHTTTSSFAAPSIPTHNWLFSEPPTLGGTHIPSVRWKGCAFYQVVQWHFSGVVAKGVQFVFFWDDVGLNNLKYVWIILLKNDFFIFQGKVATVYRWGGKIQAIDVKFSQDLTHQKLWKSANFW